MLAAKFDDGGGEQFINRAAIDLQAANSAARVALRRFGPRCLSLRELRR
jgi:hypothetical protein